MSGCGKVRASQPQRGEGLADLARRLRRGAARDGVLPSPRLIEGEGERVDVGLGTGVVALGLLGRHVGERPDHLARFR